MPRILGAKLMLKNKMNYRERSAKKERVLFSRERNLIHMIKSSPFSDENGELFTEQNLKFTAWE